MTPETTLWLIFTHTVAVAAGMLFARFILRNDIDAANARADHCRDREKAAHVQVDNIERHARFLTEARDRLAEELEQVEKAKKEGAD